MGFSTEVKLIEAIKSAKSKVEISMTANVPHALTIHEGRTPGARGPSGFHLKKWAREKLGDESLAWPIAKKIHRDGFDGVPYLTDPLQENQKQWQQAFGKKAVKVGVKTAAVLVADEWQSEARFELTSGTNRRFFKGTLSQSIDSNVTIK